MVVRKRLAQAVTLAAVIGSLASCSDVRANRDLFHEALRNATLPGPYGVAKSATPEGSTAGLGPVSDDAVDSRQVEPFEIRGTGQYVNAPNGAQRQLALADIIDTGKDGFTLNFVDADLRQVVRAILEEILGANYTIDPSIQGTVTLQTSRPLARRQIYPALQEILRLKGAAIVEADGLLRVVPSDKAALLAPIIPFGADQARGVGVRIIPLKFIAAGDLQGFLQPFSPTPGAIRFDKGRNLIFVTGTRKEAANIAGLVSMLDVNWLAGMSFALEPLKEVAPETMINELQQILDDPAGPKLSDLVRFVALDRMNAVLVVSKQPSYLDEARRWIARLDKSSSNDQRVHVYYVQNRRAAKLAEILGQIFSSDTVTIEANAPAVAPGLTPVALSVGPSEQQNGLPVDVTAKFPSPATASTPSAVTPSPETGPISVAGVGPIKIIADEDSNSLVTLATGTGYRLVEAALRQLDILPLQVLIEATLVEVTLNNDLQYGLRWFFESEKSNSSFTFTDVASSAGAAALGSSFPGFSYAFDTTNIRVTLNALQGITDVKFLSAPTLMVLDNQTARLQVGDEVPVVTRSSVSTNDPNAPIVNSIEFRDTGVILDITPRVNASGLVTLDVEQEVSEVISTTSSSIDSPTIQQRKLKSTVAVQSGETIALGGLIRDRTEEKVTGIPVLSDIPLLGNLFKSTGRGNARTELLILIKPNVVRNQDEARVATEELRRKLPSIFPEASRTEPGATPQPQ